MIQPLVDALRRYLQLLIGQDQEWNLIVAQKPALTEAIFPFSAIGLVAGAIAALVGILLRSGDRSVAVEMAFQILIDAGSVSAFAAASGAASRRFESVRPAMGEIAALYSACGIWLAALAGFVPVPALGWLWLAMGMVLTGYLYGGALSTVVGVPDHRRLHVMGLSLGALLTAEVALRLTRQVVLGAMGVY